MILHPWKSEEWLAQNNRGMILCPYQPGKLFISQRACLKRHMLGKKGKKEQCMKDDFFGYKFKQGLSLCGRCDIGKKFARSSRMKKASLPCALVTFKRPS